jgi:formylmethanofuran dehydrogenase subunit C
MILKQKPPSVPQTQGRFGSRQPMESNVLPDSARDAIHSAWTGFKLENGSVPAQMYLDAARSLEMTVWTKGHVEEFCLGFPRLKLDPGFSANMGIFLSVLVNNAHGLEFMLRTGEAHFENLGFMNTKNVIILGDGGVSCGAGNIGGTVIIHGDAGPGLGSFMEGGRLILGGNAGHKVGDHMSGGEILLHGDYESLGDVERGRIFHKGRLILEK